MIIDYSINKGYDVSLVNTLSVLSKDNALNVFIEHSNEDLENPRSPQTHSIGFAANGSFNVVSSIVGIKNLEMANGKKKRILVHRYKTTQFLRGDSSLLNDIMILAPGASTSHVVLAGGNVQPGSNDMKLRLDLGKLPHGDYNVSEGDLAESFTNLHSVKVKKSVNRLILDSISLMELSRLGIDEDNLFQEDMTIKGVLNMGWSARKKFSHYMYHVDGEKRKNNHQPNEPQDIIDELSLMGYKFNTESGMYNFSPQYESKERKHKKLSVRVPGMGSVPPLEKMLGKGRRQSPLPTGQLYGNSYFHMILPDGLATKIIDIQLETSSAIDMYTESLEEVQYHSEVLGKNIAMYMANYPDRFKDQEAIMVDHSYLGRDVRAKISLI